MQLLGTIVGAGLAVVVIAEGAYIVRTRTQLAALSERIEALSAAQLAVSEPVRQAPPAAWAREEGGESERPAPVRRLPVPRLSGEALAPESSAGQDPLPLPPEISSPVAREQLRQFVLAQLERERQERRAEADQQRDTRTRERRERVAKELGLSASETERFVALQAQYDASREQIRQRLETAAPAERAAVREQIIAVRAETEKQTRALLGDERMEKYEQLRRDGRDGGPPAGPGRGFGPGGRPFAGPPPVNLQ